MPDKIIMAKKRNKSLENNRDLEDTIEYTEMAATVKNMGAVFETKTHNIIDGATEEPYGNYQSSLALDEDSFVTANKSVNLSKDGNEADMSFVGKQISNDVFINIAEADPTIYVQHWPTGSIIINNIVEFFVFVIFGPLICFGISKLFGIYT